MRERLASLGLEFDNVSVQLTDPAVVADRARFAQLSRRYKQLDEIITASRRIDATESEITTVKEMLTDASPSDREELRGLLVEAEERLEVENEALRLLLLPRDPNDGRNVILEIRGAEGGEEANLFARDLFEMYRAYASTQGWRFEILGAQVSDMGGYQDVVVEVKGDDAWSHLKFEAGPHRVQRVPRTESQGRVHTSSATVTVLPEADEIEIEIDPNDLSVDVYRSSGPGGQSVNTTDSAVRITHEPTGLVVSMQDEKSQLQNRQKALRVLRARLLQLEQDRQASELSAARRDQIGGGGRSEKIRTYNFKENRVTDHRIGLTIHQLDRILAGDLAPVVESLQADERARQLAGTEG